jgi:hypothetical protein
MKKEMKLKCRTNDLVMMNLENETLIYDLSENKAFCLNRTSAMIWQLCDGKNSTAEMSKLLSRRLETSISEEFIWLALGEFEKNNLLEKDENFINRFTNLNRREIVKKIGLASMIAFPLVSSVIAPNAVMAGSCDSTLLAPGSPVGPTTYADLNTSNPSAGDTCLNRLKAQCCSNQGAGSCSCNVVNCSGSVTCS